MSNNNQKKINKKQGQTQCTQCYSWIPYTTEAMINHSAHFHGRIDSVWVNM